MSTHVGRAAGHAGVHHLYVPGASRVHCVPAGAKIVGTVAFATTVAVTPRTAWPVFAADAVVLAGVIATARIGARTVLVRLAAIVPFVALAALVPFVAGGPQIDVAGVGLSRDGLWAAFGIVAKAALGGGATIVLAATTPVAHLVAGLGRLRIPAVLVAVVAFMVRYLDLLAERLHRMRRAMSARGHDPRWLWQVRPIAASAGTLFVRTYERGERVHLAMLARGFTGSLPEPVDGAPERSAAPSLAAVPAALAALGLIGWLVA